MKLKPVVENTQKLQIIHGRNLVIFNENLSGCENGGELEYNSINNTVNLLSNSSDRCYVYFDKYDGVWIDNVTTTNITGSSVTLDVTATSENGSITTYYYSLNDSEYVSTNTNLIVIENLNQLTEYNIKIYAIDNTGASSNIYELNVSTTDESGPVINSVEVSDITTSGFTLTVNATSDVEISRYYYVIESNDTSGTSTNNTYSFSNLNLSTTYNISIFAEDINGVFSNKYNLNVETAEPQISLADWVISQYNGTQGNNGIYYHTSSLANSAADNSYRYAGDNPNNYVCFGSEEDTCPSSNRYRIIGVFDNQVKLIKSTSYGSYYWSGSNSNGSNVWGNSTLNTNILNRTFINNFSSTWQNKIATTSWKVGGPSVNISIYPNGTPANAYQNEVVSPEVNMTYSAKVGLMYVSDYYYGATPIFWTYPGYSYSSAPDANGNYGDSYDYRAAKGYNWLDLGSNEWTITHTSGNGNAYYVTSEGNVYLYSVDYLTNAVRPVFYFNSDVEYASGDGTRENPIRLVV